LIHPVDRADSDLVAYPLDSRALCVLWSSPGFPDGLGV